MAEAGETLSERELDVMQCVSRGASNKEIAEELTISENTVKVHLRNIYTKLDVSSRTEATTAAIQQGYITVPGMNGELTGTESPPDAGALAATAAADSLPESEEAPPRRSWRTALLLFLLLLSALIILFLGQRLLNQGEAATPQPFTETAIGDSRWLKSRPLPEGRANMAVASVGLDIYKIGGETAGGVDGKVTIFDSVNRAWREAAEKPTPVADASAVELYGELYVPGGRLADGQPTAVVEAYSPAQDAWRQVASLPQAVAGGLTLTDGAFVYVFGGWNGESYLDTVYKYDPSANSWRPLPPMPHAQAFSAGGALTGQLAVVGGLNEDGPLASCQLFDPNDELWSECPDMLLPRSAAGAAVLLNKLYVIGGSSGAGDALPYSEVYDPNTETWQVVNTPMLEEMAGWPHAGIGNIETKIYALGGKNGDAYLDDTFVYAPLVYQTFIPAAPSGSE